MAKFRVGFEVDTRGIPYIEVEASCEDEAESIAQEMVDGNWSLALNQCDFSFDCIDVIAKGE